MMTIFGPVGFTTAAVSFFSRGWTLPALSVRVHPMSGGSDPDNKAVEDVLDALYGSMHPMTTGINEESQRPTDTDLNSAGSKSLDSGTESLDCKSEILQKRKRVDEILSSLITNQEEFQKVLDLFVRFTDELRLSTGIQTKPEKNARSWSAIAYQLEVIEGDPQGHLAKLNDTVGLLDSITLGGLEPTRDHLRDVLSVIKSFSDGVGSSSPDGFSVIVDGLPSLMLTESIRAFVAAKKSAFLEKCSGFQNKMTQNRRLVDIAKQKIPQDSASIFGGGEQVDFDGKVQSFVDDLDLLPCEITKITAEGNPFSETTILEKWDALEKQGEGVIAEFTSAEEKISNAIKKAMQYIKQLKAAESQAKKQELARVAAHRSSKAVTADRSGGTGLKLVVASDGARLGLRERLTKAAKFIDTLDEHAAVQEFAREDIKALSELLTESEALTEEVLFDVEWADIVENMITVLIDNTVIDGLRVIDGKHVLKAMPSDEEALESWQKGRAEGLMRWKECCRQIALIRNAPRHLEHLRRANELLTHEHATYTKDRAILELDHLKTDMSEFKASLGCTDIMGLHTLVWVRVVGDWVRMNSAAVEWALDPQNVEAVWSSNDRSLKSLLEKEKNQFEARTDKLVASLLPLLRSLPEGKLWFEEIKKNLGQSLDKGKEALDKVSAHCRELSGTENSSGCANSTRSKKKKGKGKKNKKRC